MTETLSTGQESAVRGVLAGIEAAWAANDAEAFAAAYTDDATGALPGVFHDGKEAIRAAIAAQFAGPLKGSELVEQVAIMRFPAPETAIVTTHGGVRPAGAAEVPPEQSVYATWTLVRRDGRWLVAAYHNCPAETG